jgi:hypothetical protein
VANILGAFLGGMMPQAVAPPTKPSIAAPKEYQEVLQSYTAGMPVGSGWTIRVVSPGEWQGMSQAGTRADQDHMPHSYSDLKTRVTYIPGSIFRDLQPEAIRHVLAHELGHLTLNTADESKANKWADTWLKLNK